MAKIGKGADETNNYKSIGEQMADLLLSKDRNHDVTFLVGPQKKRVKSVKFVLKAASPVFEKEFEKNWENSRTGLTEGKGIPIPDVDPTAFKLFVNLIISDTWSLDDLRRLNLAPNSLLSLLGLCRRYEITKAIKNLEAAAVYFIHSFHNFKGTKEFLEISRENLEIIFSCEEIPLEEIEIFHCACRWAEHQCKQKKMKRTEENYREVLGGCLYEIRFPAMKLEDFTTTLFENNVLSVEEKAGIHHFITKKEKSKVNQDHGKTHNQLLFKATPRLRNRILGCSVLQLAEPFTLTANPPFLCNGKMYYNWFTVNKKISLHGIGFLGPIDADTHYDVTVQFKIFRDGFFTFDSGTIAKSIPARKREIFYFFFEEAITLEPNAGLTPAWAHRHSILYGLKGARNISQYKGENPEPEEVSVKMLDLEFNLDGDWNNGNPIAELLYKRID